MNKVPYTSTIGKLIYAMVHNIVDFAHEVGVMSQFRSKQWIEHWEGVKWLLNYLKSKCEVALCLKEKRQSWMIFFNPDLSGFIDLGKITQSFMCSQLDVQQSIGCPCYK